MATNPTESFILDKPPETNSPSKLSAWFRRPTQHDKGLVDLLTTIDHKKIGMMYGFFALTFLMIGGLEALFIRVQLMYPENNFIDARTYNQMFTMHGTTMVFLAIMPLSAAFFNFIMPLQIGARDVAFPRMNTFSLWAFVFGAIFINLSWLFPSVDGAGVGSAPAIGWFGYAPLTSKSYDAGLGTDFWIMGLQILGLASLLASFNFITTILNMRAPGLKMMRLPVFTWMTLITSFLIIMAFPAITVALVQLMFDRQFGTHFFEVEAGGKPILWQHLFWIFGHPEVYILILPVMGIVSEILPVFSRKPLFGYGLIVFSGAIIGFLGFSVWSHHMFTTGMGVIATSAFSIMTMLIAIPTGVKIFNWIGTIWGGRVKFSTPMLFSIGFISLFMLGGFTGIMHSSVPVDAQQQDSYFVIAHFHYVLIGGNIFGILGGIYYWMPKFSGRQMNETLGKVIWLGIFVGFNLAFFPMHYLGMTGMPRRTHTYKSEMGWDHWNFWSSVGALTLGAFLFIFFLQTLYTFFKGKRCKEDPWDSRTLEWATANPPKSYNFARTPIIKVRDQIWENKHGAKENSMDFEPAESHGVHMPDNSWWPFYCSVGIFIAALGMIFNRSEITVFGSTFDHGFEIPILGGVILLFSIIKWALEGPGGYHLHPEEDQTKISN